MKRVEAIRHDFMALEEFSQLNLWVRRGVLLRRFGWFRGQHLYLSKGIAVVVLSVLLPVFEVRAADRDVMVVGVVENAAPCSSRQGSIFKGHAVELW